jgi:hypothetical protein
LQAHLLDKVGQAHGQADVEINLAQDALAFFVRVLYSPGVGEDLGGLIELRVGGILGGVASFFMRRRVLEHRHARLFLDLFGHDMRGRLRSVVLSGSECRSVRLSRCI